MRLQRTVPELPIKPTLTLHAVTDEIGRLFGDRDEASTRLASSRRATPEDQALTILRGKFSRKEFEVLLGRQT